MANMTGARGGATTKRVASGRGPIFIYRINKLLEMKFWRNWKSLYRDLER